MYDNAFKTKENKIEPQRDKTEPQHMHPKTEIIHDQGNKQFRNYCLDMKFYVVDLGVNARQSRRVAAHLQVVSYDFVDCVTWFE